MARPPDEKPNKKALNKRKERELAAALERIKHLEEQNAVFRRKAQSDSERMIELSEREERLIDREARVAIREDKVAIREDKAAMKEEALNQREVSLLNRLLKS